MIISLNINIILYIYNIMSYFLDRTTGNINITGNFGIGVNNPSEKLEILDSGNSLTTIQIENDVLGTASGSSILLKTDSGFDTRLDNYGTAYTTNGAKKSNGGFLSHDGTGGFSIVASNGTSGEIRFYTDGSADNNERMCIKNDGNVGIGITNPSEKLEVVGNTNITGDYKINGYIASPMILLQTLNPSHSATPNSDNLYVNEITNLSGYDVYFIQFNSISVNAQNVNLRVQLYDTGWVTSSNSYRTTYTIRNEITGDFESTYGEFIGNHTITGYRFISGSAYLYNMHVSGNTLIEFNMVYHNGTKPKQCLGVMSAQNVYGQHDGIRFFIQGNGGDGNMTGGKIKIYGIK